MERTNPNSDGSCPRAQSVSGKPPKGLAPQEHDRYLKAACAGRVPISVFFTDGDVIPFAMLKQVGIFTLLLEVPGCGDVLVYKNALKKIAASSKLKAVEGQGTRA